MTISATFCSRGLALVVLLLLGALPLSLRAEWKITSATSSPNESIEHWKTELSNDATGEDATVHAAVFATRAATLRVIDQPNAPRQSLAEVLNDSGALAGVNGGYFDPQDAPLGLLVSDGRVLSKQRQAKLLTGVLFASGNRVDIVRASRFAMNKKIKAARQCGPLLVDGASPVAGLNDTRPARRTFAAVDGKGHAALGVCSAVSLAQLGKILALRNGVGKIKVARALNLDGGSSSAFWFKGGFSQGEFKTVRDFVAIVPPPTR
ncbi:MAG: phosphodiester glycosidase family protein [Chthoniobacterales bacterium]